MRFHALLLLACLSAPAARAAQVYIDNNELNYIGSISEEANKQAFELYAAQTKKPMVLNIRSGGGETMAGMELGRWVARQALPVKVVEYCFSSCANYVFTAAPSRVVSNFAMVGFHGGLSSTSFALDAETEASFATLPESERQAARKKIMDALFAEIAPKVQLERKFFDEIGVQQRITTLGQTDEYEKRYGSSDAVGWTYTVEDFSKLGVRNIAVVNPPWKPRSVLNKTALFTVNVD